MFVCMVINTVCESIPIGMLKRMREDQTKFGKTAFELIGAERFFR